MKKVFVGIGGGGYFIQAKKFLEKCPKNVFLIIMAPESIHNKIVDTLSSSGYIFLKPPKILKQKRKTGNFKNFLDIIVGIIFALKTIEKYSPDAVVSIGQRVSIYLMAAARIKKVKSFYVECITRVTKMSKTGRFISFFNLADNFFVQWPESVKICKKSRYEGRLL